MYVSKNWFARRPYKYSTDFFILFCAAAFLWFSSISGFFFLNWGSYAILVTIITNIMMMNDSCHFCSEFFHTFAVKYFSCHSRRRATKQMMSCRSAEAGGALTTFRTVPFVAFFTLIQTEYMLCLSVAGLEYLKQKRWSNPLIPKHSFFNQVRKNEQSKDLSDLLYLNLKWCWPLWKH